MRASIPPNCSNRITNHFYMEINLLDDSQLALLQQLTADASFVVVTCLLYTSDAADE